MAAIGNEEKEIIKQKILEVFPNSFVYDKEIRIPLNERQIKVTLTCAKTNVERGEDSITPSVNSSTTGNVAASKAEITEEEKQETLDLLKAFGF